MGKAYTRFQTKRRKNPTRWLSLASFSIVMPLWRLNVCRTVPEYLSSRYHIKRTEVSNRRTRNSQKLNIPLFKTASGWTKNVF